MTRPNAAVIAFLNELGWAMRDGANQPAVVELGPDSTITGAKITGNVTVRAHPHALIAGCHFTGGSATAVDLDWDAVGATIPKQRAAADELTRLADEMGLYHTDQEAS